MGKVMNIRIQEGELIKRNPSRIEEVITDRGMSSPKSRDDLVKFAEGKQARSEDLDLLRGLPLKEYSTPADVTRELDRLERQRTRSSKQ
ncbi:hypothetical protein MSHOH_1283 [Methanosarcina horonobensis HB-1 = JCM 15518]|uniref:Uncharacterized protein n=1 Tax=Methanosarcina horonobensis HB-1 = JCM 15518 TaxID=1434110 RepID=A0A0E3SAF1_9EURY|nr:DUF2795 domain-containing protein [Methanosarcina horonobensis]AKB77766.1 hypothetical protein MSHOH_1283 [Methanosarcina horonobensis HB-1 = JCM 15518]